MRKFLLMVPFVPLALLTTPASAQQEQPGHDACARDVTRHCRAVMNDGDQAVLACLKQHRAKISKGCDKVLVDHGQ
jgi:Cysteine rich repeat